MTQTGNSPTAPNTALQSVYTNTLADLFGQVGISLVVSTYQASKVILVRYDRDAQSLNTHFRNFDKPMGMAVHGQGAGGRLTIGGQKSVSYLRNMPAVARKLERGPSGRGKHDACYLPREIHITGDIDIVGEKGVGDGEIGRQGDG